MRRLILTIPTFAVLAAATAAVGLNSAPAIADVPGDDGMLNIVGLAEFVLSYDPDTGDPILTPFDDDLPPDGSDEQTTDYELESGGILRVTTYIISPPSPNPGGVPLSLPRVRAIPIPRLRH